MTIVFDGEIACLNNEAHTLVSEGMSATEAIDYIINTYGFQKLAGNQVSAVYSLPNERVVHCWHEGKEHSGIGGGGLGFDDQVEHCLLAAGFSRTELR